MSVLPSPSGSFREVSVIQRVETSVSDLESVFDDTVDTMEQQKQVVSSLHDELQMKKILNPVNGITQYNVEDTTAIIGDIRQQAFDYAGQVRTLIANHDPALDEAEARRRQEEMVAFVTDLSQHLANMNMKIAEVRNAANNSTASAQSGNGNTRDPRDHIGIAKARALAKAHQVIEDLSVLTADVTKIEAENWSEASDFDVESGMKSLPSWEKELKKIQEQFRFAQDLLYKEGLKDDDVPQVTVAAGQLRSAQFVLSEVKTAI